MADVRVGYYVHHHGTGHMRTALQIIPHIPGRVIVFSSASRPHAFPANADYVQLEDDAVEGYVQPPDSPFLYTPLTPSVLTRYRQIIDAVATYHVSRMYVDVSMEVALFCKMLGVSVGHNVMFGNRSDAAHDYLYELCDFYISDNAPEIDASSRRNGPHNLTYVGGISRYKKGPLRELGAIKNVAVIVSPESKRPFVRGVGDAARAYPDVTWHLIGTRGDGSDAPNVVVHGTIDDPRAIYDLADVVVGSGGHNTIMEAASLGKPFVCIPEERPYQEQTAMADALAARTMVVKSATWPTPIEWPTVFAALKTVDIARFQSLVDDDAAQKAARIIAGHA